MIKEIIEKRILGVNFTPLQEAAIYLWAPKAHSVEIDIQGMLSLPLKPLERGYWHLLTGELIPGDKYLFKIDDKGSFPDPASLFQPEGVHQPSQAFDLNSFQWNDQQWKGIQTGELIIYELHTGTFTREGTFESLASKIKYLKNLGITAVELMPVAQFPGSRNWGYDGVYPFAVQNSYGGPLGLQKLIDHLHQEKIAVILDVVYNHLGPEGNYLENFAHYFTEKYKTPWGNAINFDDQWCDGVRRFYIENALMWMRDFHVDGLRLDAIHAIKDFGAKHILEELKEYVVELNRISNSSHFLIGESDLNDVRYINPFSIGGYNLDHQWIDEFHHALHALVTGERNGYYADFGSIAYLEKSFNDAYVYDGLYSTFRKKTFGNKTTGQPKTKFIAFTQNHDQVGNRAGGERLNTLVDFETSKLIAGTLFMAPFLPMIYMGEEYGETNPFLYFTSHEDENLIHLVREGRKNEFKDFYQSGAVFHDPQSEETFNISKLNFPIQENQKILFDFHKELIRLKKNHPVIRNSTRNQMSTMTLKLTNLLVHTKRFENHFLIAIMNFEDQAFKLDFTGWENDSLQLLLNSADEKWGGFGNKEITAPDRVIPAIQLMDLIQPKTNSLNKEIKSLIVSGNSLLVFSDILI